MSRVMQFKAKVKNMALKYHVPAQAVLQNYMLERLLERVSLSKYHDRFILKGGMLIASMVGIGSRTTMDMDATLKGFPLTEERLQKAFLEICSVSVNDEVEMVLDHIVPIRDDDEYGGFRVAVSARYESINTPLKIDITTGDIITPKAVRYAFPSSFEDKRIDVWSYPIETILAEKVETILRRSVLNTRSRDFYDVYILIKTQSHILNKEIFHDALIATAEKRGSLFLLQNVENNLATIRTDSIMGSRWSSYCRDNFYAEGISFNEVIELLTGILLK